MTPAVRILLARLSCTRAGISAASPRPARADITAFLGVTPTPERHTLKRGFSAGFGLLIVGFEFEYAHDRRRHRRAAAGAQDLLRQRPGADADRSDRARSSMRPAAPDGYRETLGCSQETHVGTNIGGGAKIKLLGPLRVRLDYRDLQAAGLAAAQTSINASTSAPT